MCFLTILEIFVNPIVIYAHSELEPFQRLQFLHGVLFFGLAVKKLLNVMREIVMCND